MKYVTRANPVGYPNWQPANAPYETTPTKNNRPPMLSVSGPPLTL